MSNQYNPYNQPPPYTNQPGYPPPGSAGYCPQGGYYPPQTQQPGYGAQPHVVYVEERRGGGHQDSGCCFPLLMGLCAGCCIADCCDCCC